MAGYLSFAERFWSKVQVTGDSECWNWLGAKINTGYGLLTKAKNEGRKESLAHWIAWVLCFGEIRGNLEVGHKCANRLCVNPSHLYLTTRIENLKEMKERGKYKFIAQLEPETLARALLHARSINAVWKIRNTEFRKLSQDKIIKLHGIIFDEQYEPKNLISEYTKPELEIMVCGHHARYIVQSQEGTAWCVMCEYTATNNVLEKIRGLLAPE